VRLNPGIRFQYREKSNSRSQKSLADDRTYERTLFRTSEMSINLTLSTIFDSANSPCSMRVETNVRLYGNSHSIVYLLGRCRVGSITSDTATNSKLERGTARGSGVLLPLPIRCDPCLDQSSVLGNDGKDARVRLALSPAQIAETALRREMDKWSCQGKKLPPRMGR
jgi:hypothetical protein